MLKFFFLVLLCGCATTHNPKPIDTKFDEAKRDWFAVYREEIRIAIENDDKEAHYFFLQELIKMRFESAHGLKIGENPKIKFLD